ncbi:MAG: hypothetical protein ACFB2W_00020 [Leptolyngbyaceae cyanobacterium]
MSGFGDVIALFSKLLGISQKPGCGCDKRRDLFNKAVPFPKWFRQMTASFKPD